MSDQKISQLSDGGASQATDEYVIARSGANYRIDGASVAAAATSVGTLSSLTVSGVATVSGTTNYLRVATTGTPSSGDAALQVSVNGTNSRSIRLENTDTGGRVYDIINGAAGTAGNLGLYDNTAGAYRLILDASGNLAVDTNTLYVDAANNNVGIGTASPTNTAGYTTLHVVGSTGALFRYNNSGGTIQLYGGSDTASGFIGTSTNHPLVFYTNASEKARLDASGNLGLGVTPSAWSTAGGTRALQVGSAGTSVYTTSGNTHFGANHYWNGTNYIFTDAGRALLYVQEPFAGHSWRTSTTEPGSGGGNVTFTTAMTLDASGNLGVGVTPPASTTGISFKGPSGDAQYRLYNSTSGSTSNDGVMLSLATDLKGYLWNYENEAFLFGTNNTERVRITSGGNLLVGDTATTAFFDGSTCSYNASYPGVSAKTGGGDSMPALTSWNNATSGDNRFVEFATETTASNRGNIDYNRGAGQVRYNTTSDATLKNIIGDADGQKSVAILASTRIREYAWKDDETQKPQIGVIAQELYETFKGAVSVGGEVERTDEEGNVTTSYTPWAVDKTAFTFHLVAGWQAHEKALQEAMARIEALEVEVAALKAGA